MKFDARLKHIYEILPLPPSEGVPGLGVVHSAPLYIATDVVGFNASAALSYCEFWRRSDAKKL